MESRRPPGLTYSIPPVFDAGPKSCPFLVAPCGQQAEVGPARPSESWENSWQPKQRFRIDQVPPRLPTWANENERQKPSDIFQKTQKNGFTNAVHPTSPMKVFRFQHALHWKVSVRSFSFESQLMVPHHTGQKLREVENSGPLETFV